MMKWTVDEIAVCICALLLSLYYSWYNTADWFTFVCIAVVGTAVCIAIYAVVRAFVSWFVALKEEGVEFNPLAHFGLRGTKPYKEAYTKLFLAVRQLEEQEDLRYFVNSDVFNMAFYGPDDKLKSYEIRARDRAWNDIKPLLREYAENSDAIRRYYVGFLKR